MLSLIFSKKKASFLSDDEGLRTLTKLGNGNSNVVIKPIFLLDQITLKSINPSADADADDPHPPSNYCYLKSCHLCHKPLALDKEIYMYMGDLGFCSVGCRERQIYLDETKEIELSTQRILASFRQRRRDSGGRCETGGLVEDYRRRPRHPHKSRVIFS